MELLYQRELSFFRDFQKWLHHLLLDEPGVVMSFSGSYTSAVAWKLLDCVYQGKIDAVHIKVQGEPWKEDLCSLWAKELGLKFRTLDFTPIATVLEDQVEDLFEHKAKYIPEVVQLGLKFVAMSSNRPLIWTGDSNVQVLSGQPAERVPVVAPLYDMSHLQVRKLGGILGVSDEFLMDHPGLPKGAYREITEAYWDFDHIAGVWRAHQGDFYESGENPQDIQDFSWASDALEDEFDKAVMREIVDRRYESRKKVFRTFRDYTLQRWGSPFDLEISKSQKYTTLGSLSFSWEPKKIVVDGMCTEGNHIQFSIFRSQENLNILGEVFQDDSPILNLLNKEGHLSRIVKFELTEDSREEFYSGGTK